MVLRTLGSSAAAACSLAEYVEYLTKFQTERTRARGARGVGVTTVSGVFSSVSSGCVRSCVLSPVCAHRLTVIFMVDVIAVCFMFLP